jgi:flagellar basal-body rod modification protein FlgD
MTSIINALQAATKSSASRYDATVPDTLPPSTSATPPITVLPTQALGQNDFLKLLVTQLTSQDPLNPQTDTQFIAQMAQFTSLEQTKTMTADIAQMQAGQQMSQAQSLLGRTVQISTGKDTSVTGQVQTIQMVDGTPKLNVNGQLYDLSQVVAITTPSALQTSYR